MICVPNLNYYELMGENRDTDIATGLTRASMDREVMDVYATGDRLGILSHPDRQTTHALKDFFPKMLEGLLDVEAAVSQVARRRDGSPAVSHDAQREYDGLLRLTTAVSRVLYFPEPDDDWFLKRYGKSFTSSASVTSYTDADSSYKPRALSPENFDFKQPSVWSLQVEDTVNGQKVFFEVFPTPYTHYPGFSSLDGAPYATAKQALTERRVDPERISMVLAEAQRTAVGPHMRIRLEGRDGEPISRVDGDLVARETGERRELGFRFHLKAEDPEVIETQNFVQARSKDPDVVALEQKAVFVALPSLKNDNLVRLASTARAFAGMGIKKEFQIRQPVQNAASGR